MHSPNGADSKRQREIAELILKEDADFVLLNEFRQDSCHHAHRTKEVALQSSHPVIIMGDMNDFNRSALLDTFAINGFRDSWWEGGNGYGHTFHSGWMRLRIDHILHSEQLVLKSIKVIGTNLSDHNPVVAGISKKMKDEKA